MTSSSNPFLIEDENPLSPGSINPFSDPSISQALSSNTYSAVDVIAEEDKENVIQNSSSSSPLATNLKPMPAEITSKEAELARREAALNEREAQLKTEQNKLRLSASHAPNWPPYYPMIYHDIAVEIPEAYQEKMTKIYKYWLANVVLLLWNLITTFVLLVSPPGLPSAATDFGVALVYTFFISASSFYLWYRPVYNGYMKENSLYFSLFLLFAGCHVLFCYYMAIGFPSAGSGGFINLFGAFSNRKIVAGVLCVVDFAGFIAAGTYGLWIWKDVHSHYRAAGHTLDSARNEAVGFGVRQGVASGLQRNSSNV